jgi:hypothetical protein
MPFASTLQEVLPNRNLGAIDHPGSCHLLASMTTIMLSQMGKVFHFCLYSCTLTKSVVLHPIPTNAVLKWDLSLLFYRDLEEGSADECFEINDRASETSYGSGNSGQEPDRVRSQLIFLSLNITPSMEERNFLLPFHHGSLILFPFPITRNGVQIENKCSFLKWLLFHAERECYFA